MATAPLITMKLIALAVVFTATSLARADEASLATLAERSGRYIGAAVAPDYLDEKPYAQLLDTQFDAVTPENAMKWGPVEPVEGLFNWRGADDIVDYAKAHHMKVRGHTLVWHSQLPNWLTQGALSAADLKQKMIDHIRLEAGRYKGAVYAWDVVNEAFSDNGSWRPSIWYEAMGPDYVRIALRTAHEADPGAKLYINDYNIETDGPKQQAIFGLVASLKHEGVPLDGVGFQAHFVGGHIPDDFAATLKRFAVLGVDVAITELDIRIPQPSTPGALSRQAEDFATVTTACVAAPRCVGITTWGLSADHSWIPSFFSGYGDALLWGDDYRAKPAVAAVAKALGAP